MTLDVISNALEEYNKCYDATLPQLQKAQIMSIEETAVAKLKAQNRFVLILAKDIYPRLSNEDRKVCENFKQNPSIISLEKVGVVLRNINKNHS